MKSIIKSSKKTSVDDAFNDAVSDINNPIGIIFMSDYYRMPDFAIKLKERFPNAEIIGTCGTVHHDAFISDKNIFVVIAITGDAKLSMGVFNNLSKGPLLDLYKLKESVNRVSPGREDTVCMEFCTSNEEILVSTMNVVLGPNGIPMAGSTVFGMPDGQVGRVSYNGEVFEDACIYAVIKNLSGKAYVFRENIYACNGPKHIATKVNLKNKELLELDYKPAQTVYSEETGIKKSDIVVNENVWQAPIGRMIDNEIYVISMKNLVSGGGIENYKRINKNDSVYVLGLQDYKKINEDTKELVRSKSGRPSFIFMINCIHRYLLFLQEGYLNEYLKKMATISPSAGYIAGGEQYNRQHINQSLVCVVFE